MRNLGEKDYVHYMVGRVLFISSSQAIPRGKKLIKYIEDKLSNSQDKSDRLRSQKEKSRKP